MADAGLDTAAQNTQNPVGKSVEPTPEHVPESAITRPSGGESRLKAWYRAVVDFRIGGGSQRTLDQTFGQPQWLARMTPWLHVLQTAAVTITCGRCSYRASRLALREYLLLPDVRFDSEVLSRGRHEALHRGYPLRVVVWAVRQSACLCRLVADLLRR